MNTTLPLHVVFLLQDLKFGGTQTQTLALAQRMDPDRFRTEIWTLISGGDLDAGATPLTELGGKDRVGATSLFRLWRQLRRSHPDILVLMTVVPNIWGRVLGKLTGTSLIVGTCRGEGAPRRQHEQCLWSKANHVVCNTQALEQEVKQLCSAPGPKISVITNGVDTDAFQPSSFPEKPVIFSAGRLVHMKDHATLIAAFGLLREKHPDVELRIAGDGPLRGKLTDICSRLPYGSFRILGGQQDLRPHYRECTVFALSSREGEGMPNVVLEAMACGRPVVATAIDGLPETVEEGKTGLLVPQENPSALADALSKLLDDPKLAARMGEAGRKRVMQNFSMEAMIQAYESLFTNLARK